jgi:hypothetical protein
VITEQYKLLWELLYITHYNDDVIYLISSTQ